LRVFQVTAFLEFLHRTNLKADAEKLLLDGFME